MGYHDHMQKIASLDILTDKNLQQRVMRLSLTEKGKSCIQGVWTVAQQMEELMFCDMTGEEVALLKRLLLQISDNLDRK